MVAVVVLPASASAGWTELPDSMTNTSYMQPVAVAVPNKLDLLDF
ncbi:hypothetical protein [Neomoorella thermoacetica]|nr:hypothetical protein [Moorella thermoacetica]